MSELKGLQPGRAWEYRAHRAAFLTGWYVRRGVNLRERVAGAPQTMGEVDLLGLDFDVAMVPRLLIGECKDRKGGAKEADRVVWLLGIKSALRAQQVLFAKPKISEGTYVWARPLDVLLWDEAAVQTIEKHHGLDPDIGYAGSFNAPFLEGTLAAARKLSPAEAGFRRAWDYISAAFWYSPNAARTKRLPAYFEVLSRTPSIGDLARDSFVAEGLIALLVSTLTAAGHLARVSPARAKVWVTDAFASGVASTAALRDIAARADEYYRDALSKAARAGGSPVRPFDVPRLVHHIAQPPEWLNDFLELTAHLGARPQHTNDLLRYADLLLYEQLLAGNVIPRGVLASIASTTDRLLPLVQFGGYFLKRVWGVEAPLLERLLALNGTSRTGDDAGNAASIHTSRSTTRSHI